MCRIDGELDLNGAVLLLRSEGDARAEWVTVPIGERSAGGLIHKRTGDGMLDTCLDIRVGDGIGELDLLADLDGVLAVFAGERGADDGGIGLRGLLHLVIVMVLELVLATAVAVEVDLGVILQGVASAVIVGDLHMDDSRCIVTGNALADLELTGGEVDLGLLAVLIGHLRGGGPVLVQGEGIDGIPVLTGIGAILLLDLTAETVIAECRELAGAVEIDEDGDPIGVRTVALGGLGCVVHVIMGVLDAVTVPIVLTRGEAGFDAPVLETDCSDVLALGKLEVGYLKVLGLGGGHVGFPKLPAGVINLAAVFAKGFGIGLVGEPRVAVSIGKGLVGTGFVGVIGWCLIGLVPDVHLAIEVLVRLRGRDRIEGGLTGHDSVKVVLDGELIRPGVRGGAEIEGVIIASVI